ncbi:MAG: AAA domain-containing protein [Elusimicrobiota bacterium]|jgi:superfamily I DNA and/or RNA helicase
MPSTEGRYERLLQLLELEREAEREETRRELERLGEDAREALGRSVARLTLESVDETEAGYRTLLLVRPPRKGEELSPFHAMDQGDSVRVVLPSGADPGWIYGTLERVEEDRARVAVDGALPARFPTGRYALDLMGSDATWRRMRRAVSEISSAHGLWAARLRDILRGSAVPEPGVERPVEFLDRTLNEWQRRAVVSALKAGDVALIHGPPGTGKTTTLVEVIRQAARRGDRVLATAPSNVAVDNMLERLLPDLDAGLRVVRLGHPAKTLESLRRANLRVIAAADPQHHQAETLLGERERLLKRLARQGRRGVPPEERGRALFEVRRLEREARELELAIARRLVLSAQVVLCTHGGISRRWLPGDFDLIALDEASQATEPLSWIPLLRGRKAVFAGDSMQLPPTLRSREAAPELGRTLFDRLKDLLPDTMQTLLREQYRMNERLMEFPSREFYGGALIAHPSVSGHLASDLPRVKESELTGQPLVFIDTAGTGWEEGFDELLQSRENEGEAGLAARIVAELQEAGLRARDIGLLSPYVAQVRRLRALVKPPVEVGTVDGFQGREKEAVVVSLVRSNEKGEVGFLSDTRRMNVAITRARRLLVLIGDSATLSRHPFYRRFLAHIEARGAHKSAYEWAA